MSVSYLSILLCISRILLLKRENLFFDVRNRIIADVLRKLTNYIPMISSTGELALKIFHLGLNL